jgi:hypothetical protein
MYAKITIKYFGDDLYLSLLQEHGRQKTGSNIAEYSNNLQVHRAYGRINYPYLANEA